MTRFQVCLILASVGWMAILAVALAWFRGAAIGNQRYDQTIADHYPDKDQT